MPGGPHIRGKCPSDPFLRPEQPRSPLPNGIASGCAAAVSLVWVCAVSPTGCCRLNAAFSALPYYTDIASEQLRSQMQGLPALMDPDLIVDITGANDPTDAPPRCFALVIPDPVPILRRHGGRLGVRTVLDLLRHRQTIKDAVLIIQGTDPCHQSSGLLSLAIRELNSALVAKGYRRLRVTFIAEDNPASAAVFARSGGRQLHRLVFVDRTLLSSPPEERP